MSTKETRFFVIEHEYVESDQDDHPDGHILMVATSPPARSPSGHSGWCGTVDGWAIFEHGSYSSLREARGYIAERWGAVRVDEDSADDAGALLAYRVGALVPMGREQTERFVASRLDDVTEASTDAELNGIASACEIDARTRQGAALSMEYAVSYLRSRRDALAEGVRVPQSVLDEIWDAADDENIIQAWDMVRIAGPGDPTRHTTCHMRAAMGWAGASDRQIEEYIESRT